MRFLFIYSGTWGHHSGTWYLFYTILSQWASLLGQRKCHLWMVLRFNSSKRPVDPWSTWLGLQMAMESVPSVSTMLPRSLSSQWCQSVTWMWWTCFMTSSSNPEVAICPCPVVKVTIIMVMSSGNPDVTSRPYDQVSCWKSLAMGVTWYPSYPVPLMMVFPNQLDDGLYDHRAHLSESVSCI